MLQFSNFDLIIEVKRGDDWRQYQTQLEHQIRAYFNGRKGGKELFYIIFGCSNNNEFNENVKLDYEQENETKSILTTINKCNWMDLLIEVYKLKEQLALFTTPIPYKYAMIHILDDLIAGFNYHVFFNIKWFRQMRSYSINKKSLSTFNSLIKNENSVLHELCNTNKS